MIGIGASLTSRVLLFSSYAFLLLLTENGLASDLES